jgi:hypothetical protein
MLRQIWPSLVGTVLAVLALLWAGTRMRRQRQGTLRTALIEGFGPGFKEGMEALEWLRANKNPSALATNRFGDTANAIKFVEELYKLGAERVTIAGVRDESWRVQAEGGPYADALIVYLPENPRKRGKLFAKAWEEARRGAMEAEPDHGQDRIYFWWD